MQETGRIYPETADIETSSDDYAGRFAGAAGQWLLEVQERITLQFLRGHPGARVLDVGGGHGQLAIPMCKAGFDVTVLSSAESCKKRIREIVDSGQCKFLVGNVIALPFPDKSFDVVIAFRMVTHCEQWPMLIRELCRVAKNAVIVDYPTSQSLNAVAPALFNAKKKIETNTRTWILFRHKQIMDAFKDCGWNLHGRKGQFFLPMVLHRMLKSRGVSAFLESVCRALGLTRLWGSPVIIEMRPCK